MAMVFSARARASLEPHPGMASNTSSPAFVYTSSWSGEKAAPGWMSSPVATLYASRPGFRKVMTERNSRNTFFAFSFLFFSPAV